MEHGRAAPDVTSDAAIAEWIADSNDRQLHKVRRIAIPELRRWHVEESTGNLRHDSGRFFSVEGLDVYTDYGPTAHWSQPIINQAEIGILGILVRWRDGELHCLMQAKSEPGNINGVQISPTVQATRSNYTRVHEGQPVPFLSYFQDPPPARVLADVLQSEQGSWFYRKRNRNMIVEIDEELELSADFRWLTLRQLEDLLAVDNLVNMDARTVLSCMPAAMFPPRPGELGDAVTRSTHRPARGLHTQTEVMSWITARQTQHLVETTLIPLDAIKQWRRTEDRICHQFGLYFSVIAVEVDTNSREVASWTQPLIEPHGVGVVALLVKRVDGVLHALFNARVEPGYLDVVELAPTVQCTPDNYTAISATEPPPFLDLVCAARPEQVLFSTELSEEGGRFYQARSRYQIIEVDAGFPDEGLPDFHWLTLFQVGDLLRHSHYVNVQARSLVAGLRGLA